jgi:hypothetical protein
LITVYRWVQRFTPLFTDAGRPLRYSTGDRFVDEAYVGVAGRWRYLYRAVDQYGPVIDVLLSEHRDTAAARSPHDIAARPASIRHFRYAVPCRSGQASRRDTPQDHEESGLGVGFHVVPRRADRP